MVVYCLAENKMFTLRDVGIIFDVELYDASCLSLSININTFRTGMGSALFLCFQLLS